MSSLKIWLIIDTPKEDVEQHRKQECLKGAISKGKVYLLEGNKQWAQERIDKSSDKTINLAYTEYKQPELNEGGEKTGKALDKHVVSLYSSGTSQVVKIRDVKN